VARDIRFWRDENNHLAFDAEKLSPAWTVGQWLLDDVQGSGLGLLKVLDGVAHQPYETSGNAWFAKVDGDQVTLENHFNDNLTATVPLDTALEILRAYWDALGEEAISEGRAYFLKYEKRQPNLPW